MGVDETEQRKRDGYYGFYEKLKAERENMHTETITVTPKYVNQPKPGGKMGNINDGQKHIFMWPEKLNLFEVGKSYQIEVEITPKAGEKPFVKFSKMLETVASEPAPQGETSSAPRNDTSKEIFVTGVVGRAMGSGQFGLNDVKGLTAAAKGAWESVMEGEVQRGMQDDIPYPTSEEDYGRP